MAGLLDYLNRGASALSGGSVGNYGGLLDEQQQQEIQRAQQMALAAQLLEAGGPSTQRTSLGQALGRGMQAAQQARGASIDDRLKAALLQKQISAADKTNSPNSVREYEYAKANGFKGNFQDWIVAGGQSSRPSAVQEWDHYVKLMEDDKKNGTNNSQLYLEMKRNPNFHFGNVAGVPTATYASQVGGVSSTPLSSLTREASAVGTLKRAEAEGGALGKGEGDIEAGIQKKGSDAVSVKSTIEQARKYIPKATGSAGGAAYDATLATFGTSTEGAKAIARLKVMQAQLMLNQPRMEGPQSDRDTQLYREAAGQIGDPAVPRETKMEALNTIEEINNRYQERASGATPSSKAPKRIRVDAQGNVIK